MLPGEETTAEPAPKTTAEELTGFFAGLGNSLKEKRESFENLIVRALAEKRNLLTSEDQQFLSDYIEKFKTLKDKIAWFEERSRKHTESDDPIAYIVGILQESLADDEFKELLVYLTKFSDKFVFLCETIEMNESAARALTDLPKQFITGEYLTLLKQISAWAEKNNKGYILGMSNRMIRNIEEFTRTFSQEVQEQRAIETQEMFKYRDIDKSKNYPGIGEMILRAGIQKGRYINPSDLEKAAQEIADAIRTGELLKIQGKLNQYGFISRTSTDPLVFKKVVKELAKQASYYRKFNSNIRNAVLAVGARIDADTASTTMKVKAKLAKYLSTTEYVIEEINKAYKKGDLGKIKKYLSILGLNEKQVNIAAVSIQSMFPPQTSKETVATPTQVSKKATTTPGARKKQLATGREKKPPSGMYPKHQKKHTGLAY